MSEATEIDQELVEAVKELFKAKCGEFRLEEFMKVRTLDLWEDELTPSLITADRRYQQIPSTHLINV